MPKLVSIIIPTYNRAHLLGATLDSVLLQSYSHWECLVIDDGSTDGTEALVKAYMAQDSRFQYHKRPRERPKGANACRNYGLELSKGQYINWLDSDDLLVANKLETQLALLQDNLGSLCISQSQFFEQRIGDRDTLWSDSLKYDLAIDDLLGERVRWGIGALLWSRAKALNVLWDEGLQGAQEWLYHIRQVLLIPQDEIFYLSDVFLYVRTGNDSITRQDNLVFRYKHYLLARIKLLDYLYTYDKALFHKYFSTIYRFTLRYVKVLIKTNRYCVINQLGKFLGKVSLLLFCKYYFGVLIYKLIKKDFFLKQVIK